MSSISIELPYYQIKADSSSTSGWTVFQIEMFDDDGNGGVVGYTHDQLADAIRDAIGNLTGVTSITLDKHSETVTSL